MRIVRAVKCAGIPKQLERALEVAKRTNMQGLEIQALSSLIEEKDFKERGMIVVDACKKYGKITSLIYHFPVISLEHSSVREIEKFDLASEQGEHVLELTKNTLQEANYVAKKLNLQGEIPIIVHVWGIMRWFDVTNPEERAKAKDQREEFFKRSVERLKELKIFGKELSHGKDYDLELTLEIGAAGNRSEASYSLCCDARDVEKIREQTGVKVCLDLAHLKLTTDYLTHSREYWKKLGKELPAVELIREIYPNQLSLEQSFELLLPSTNSFHMNDVKDNYDVPSEGCEIGKGNFPFKNIFPLIIKNLKKEKVIGTYEITDAYLEAEKMYRSDKKLKKILGERLFREYFV